MNYARNDIGNPAQPLCRAGSEAYQACVQQGLIRIQTCNLQASQGDKVGNMSLIAYR